MIAIDGVPERLELARAFGADETIGLADYPETEDRVRAVLELTGGIGADMVLEVTGVPASFVEAIDLARVGGRIASVGNLNAEAPVTMVPGMVTRKSVHVHGVLRYDPWYLHKAVQFLARRQHLHPFEAFSDRSFPLAEVTEALKAGETARSRASPSSPEPDPTREDPPWTSPPSSSSTVSGGTRRMAPPSRSSTRPPARSSPRWPTRPRTTSAR